MLFIDNALGSVAVDGEASIWAALTRPTDGVASSIVETSQSRLGAIDSPTENMALRRKFRRSMSARPTRSTASSADDGGAA